MPRPTSAQIVYGSATVVLSTLLMLLLSRTSSGVGIAVVSLGALALGLLVAALVPGARRSPRAEAVAPPVRRPAEARPAGARAGARMSERVGEHSLHG
ncbi:hypothetical protein [Streptomyces mobaraensis]|uniref:Uncharacterized protein n=1 Tax=Streptomyces mobaraensis TaxID=35621 RepID=A0A5N5WDR6_STRMB|nr:hypothetical protein [Streptomyces mobaraensis]KAB7849877.1 hypothetical protein FRZ00_04340 [Streptomyces mobaraensis]